jgi:hypothetical protein
VIEVREEQFIKAASPILVMLFGIVKETRDEQPEKTLCSRRITLFGSIIEVREEQPEKACIPTFVTFLGIIIDLRFIIPAHNHAGIVSTLSPKVKDVIWERML